MPRTKIRKPYRLTRIASLPRVSHGSGSTDYARVRRFGVPAKRDADIIELIDNLERWEANKQAHELDKARQTRESTLDWNRVRMLLQDGMTLEQAKQAVSQ